MLQALWCKRWWSGCILCAENISVPGPPKEVGVFPDHLIPCINPCGIIYAWYFIFCKGYKVLNMLEHHYNYFDRNRKPLTFSYPASKVAFQTTNDQAYRAMFVVAEDIR